MKKVIMFFSEQAEKTNLSDYCDAFYFHSRFATIKGACEMRAQHAYLVQGLEMPANVFSVEAEDEDDPSVRLKLMEIAGTRFMTDNEDKEFWKELFDEEKQHKEKVMQVVDNFTRREWQEWAKNGNPVPDYFKHLLEE